MSRLDQHIEGPVTIARSWSSPALRTRSRLCSVAQHLCPQINCSNHGNKMFHPTKSILPDSGLGQTSGWGKLRKHRLVVRRLGAMAYGRSVVAPASSDPNARRKNDAGWDLVKSRTDMYHAWPSSASSPFSYTPLTTHERTPISTNLQNSRSMFSCHPWNL